MSVFGDDGMPQTRWRERARVALHSQRAQMLGGVVAMGLLALVYLNQVAGVTLANTRLQKLQAERSQLERQRAELQAQLGASTSPAYIDQQARAMGLAPAAQGSAIFLLVHGPVPQGGVGGQP
jgi:cell division protein FtsB